jgi:hypothetical protein
MMCKKMPIKSTFELVQCALCVSLLFAAAATPDDLVQPSWRGSDGSTLQVWTFDDDDNPAAPETDNNPYGTAEATITVGDFGEEWLDTVSFGSQTGIWDLGREGTIVLDIPNSSEALPYKEIWLQVTYYDSIVKAPVVTIPGATFVSDQTLVVEEDDLGDWLLDQSVWRIEPNPSSEEITLTADWNGSTIDQVVVDTICIPEPATAIILAIGTMAAIMRRRRLPN